jgi:Sugar (and other) transporter
VQGSDVHANGTAAAEQELLVLWSAVEQDRATTGGTSAQQNALRYVSASQGSSPAGQRHDRQRANPFAASLHRDEGTGENMATAGTQDGDGMLHDGSKESACKAGKEMLETGRNLKAALDNVGDTVHVEDGAVQAEGLGQPLSALDPQHVQPQPLESAQYDATQPFLRVLWRMLQDTRQLIHGPERRAVLLTVSLAVFNQIGASTSIINYAPQVLEKAGVLHDQQAILISSLIAAAKAVGVGLGALLPSLRASVRDLHIASCLEGVIIVVLSQ